MPIYEDQCRKCGYTNEYITKHFTDQTVACPKCGGESDRLISTYAPKIFQAFDTTNCSRDGRKMHFGSERDLARACRENGVIHAPDGAPPPTSFLKIGS